MWHDNGPGFDVVPEIYYSANFYADRAISIIKSHNLSRQLFMYLAIQNVHAPYTLPPSWEHADSYPGMWDVKY